jgi:hypothetical protein
MAFLVETAKIPQGAEACEAPVRILIDVSGSMDESVLVKGCVRKKADVVRDQLAAMVGRFPTRTFEVFAFNDRLRLLGQCRTADDLARLRLPEPNGGSLIWQSVMEALDGIAGGAGALMICVTDGDDTGSGVTRDEVEALAEGRGVDLRVFQIGADGGAIGESEGSSVVKRVDDLEELSVELSKAVASSHPAAAVATHSTPFSAVVLPLEAQYSSRTHIDLVRGAMQRVVPYLEAVTNLRYYPVPSVLVDEYTLTELIPAGGEPPDAALLRENLREIIAFLHGVALTFHTRSFDPDVIHEYERYSNLSGDVLFRLRGLAEGLFGLSHIARADGFELPTYRDNFIPEISKRPDFILNAYDDCVEMLLILKRIRKARGGEIRLEPCYVRRENPEPNLDAWKPHVKRKEFEDLRDCLDHEGRWRLDIDSIVRAAEIGIRVVFEVLPDALRSSNPLHSVITTIHTFGVYLHPSEEPDPAIRELCLKAGFPSWFRLCRTGLVALSLGRIRDAATKAEANGSWTGDGLFEGLTQAVLAHEHAHAITYEGIDASSHRRVATPFSGRGAVAVSETLAEWMELNFVRGDQRLRGLVLDHALSGRFPQWPYAGAVILENRYNPGDPDLSDVRALLGYFRNNSDKTYKLLTELR